METDRPKIINESANQTRIRLGETFAKLTDKRIDLTRVSRGIVPEYQLLAIHSNIPIVEAIPLVDHVLFNIWEQIQESGDNLLVSIAEQERGRLRNFFNTPLDDR